VGQELGQAAESLARNGASEPDFDGFVAVGLHLAKVDVDGSIPFIRSTRKAADYGGFSRFSAVLG
jgi:hypothetical protein